MHLPRSVFSQRQLDLFLWLLKVNDVDDVPSVKSMQTLNTMLQKMCGIDSIKYEGALGHSYYVNSLSQIIAQVFSPISLITSIIHVLAGNGQSEGQSTPQVLSRGQPEASIGGLSSTSLAAWGGQWWDHTNGTLGKQDYYIQKPAMLQNGECCVPVHWFTVREVLFAKCWKMTAVSSNVGQGWRIIQCNDFSVAHTQFLKNFPNLCNDANSHYRLPHPSQILGCW